MKEQLLVILGPTACGKTGVSIELAQKLNGEIVSADSVAVYRGMEIGSARPNKQEQMGVPHHLIDCIDCSDETFSVARYKELAVSAIDDILSRKRLPILTGGSGLYLDAVTAPMTYAAPSDLLLRNELNEEYLSDPHAFHKRLGTLDPVMAGRLHTNDRKRLVRALEICVLTGKPMSEQTVAYEQRQAESGQYTFRKIGLRMQRETLYARIDSRVNKMLEDGLIDEARTLYDLKLPRTLPAMKSIGYTQFFAYFDGDLSLQDAVDSIKRDTRRFAKRQMTWFRRDASIRWYDWEDYADSSELSDAIRHDLEDMGYA